MNIESVREYCLNRKGVTESFPFDETTLVFKVIGKIFALVNLDGDPSINLKCDPEKAVLLREQYESVIPGYHMNKKHWNTIRLDSMLPEHLIREWIDDSYRLVMLKMSKTDRKKLGMD